MATDEPVMLLVFIWRPESFKAATRKDFMEKILKSFSKLWARFY